jgi:hypothetical protein
MDMLDHGKRLRRSRTDAARHRPWVGTMAPNSQAEAEKWIVEHRWLMRRQNDLEAANDH